MPVCGQMAPSTLKTAKKIVQSIWGYKKSRLKPDDLHKHQCAVQAQMTKTHTIVCHFNIFHSNPARHIGLREIQLPLSFSYSIFAVT